LIGFFFPEPDALSDDLTRKKDWFRSHLCEHTLEGVSSVAKIRRTHSVSCINDIQKEKRTSRFESIKTSQLKAHGT
jgi:hypothetical protein